MLRGDEAIESIAASVSVAIAIVYSRCWWWYVDAPAECRGPTWFIHDLLHPSVSVEGQPCDDSISSPDPTNSRCFCTRAASRTANGGMHPYIRSAPLAHVPASRHILGSWPGIGFLVRPTFWFTITIRFLFFILKNHAGPSRWLRYGGGV